MKDWITALCLVCSAFIGCGVGHYQAERFHEENVKWYERQIALLQLCQIPPLPHGEQRVLVTYYMCKELMSK